MPSLNVNIMSGEKGPLYNLEIQNTQVDDVKGIGSYAATLSGVGLEGPLTVKLRKFNRSLGAVKLTSRVLGRLFRKHMDKLVTMTPQAATPPKTRTRTKTVKQAKGNGSVAAAASAPAPTPAPPPAPAPAPVPEPVAAPTVSQAFQV
jgi:hypothetical protein